MKIISSIIFNGNFLEKNKNIDENITGWGVVLGVIGDGNGCTYRWIDY